MLHHIALIASDRDRAVAFYQALGFCVTQEIARPERNDVLLFLTDGETTLELFIKKDCPARPNYPEAYGLRHLALKVRDAEELAAALRAKGYAPEPVRRDALTGEKVTFVSDPDGLPVELHE